MIDNELGYDDEAEGKDNDDTRPDRRHQSRRGSDWSGPGKFLFKVAASTAGVVFAAGFLMTILGWRFTGNAADIATNSANIATNTADIAMHAKDIAELKKTSHSILFMQCAMYRKLYPDAPALADCTRLER